MGDNPRDDDLARKAQEVVGQAARSLRDAAENVDVGDLRERIERMSGRLVDKLGITEADVAASADTVFARLGHEVEGAKMHLKGLREHLREKGVEVDAIEARLREAADRLRQVAEHPEKAEDAPP